jgi:hypothetical protein
MEINEDLIQDLEDLLTAARQGRLDNLMYFAELSGDRLLAGQRGAMALDKIEDAIGVMEQLMEAMAVQDDIVGARRLVRV